VSNANTTTLAVKDCWPWQHRWTKWKVIDSGTLTFEPELHPGEKHGLYETQKRECVDCGKSELRRAESV